MLPCPRRAESPPAPFLGDPAKDHFRNDHTCNFCGSYDPELFMQHLEDGSGELVGTDKSYKAYLRIPNERAGKKYIVGCANTTERPHGEGWRKVNPILRLIYKLTKHDQWVCFSEEPETKQVKFYYMHLSDSQKDRFIELLNKHTATRGRGRDDRVMFKFGFPGHLYVRPYFTRPAS